MKKYFYRIIILNIVLSVCFAPTAIQAQEGITKFEKWLAVGELHNWFSSIGCEREEDGPELQQQAGWRWPAPYLNQDMQAAKEIILILMLVLHTIIKLFTVDQDLKPEESTKSFSRLNLRIMQNLILLPFMSMVKKLSFL